MMLIIGQVIQAKLKDHQHFLARIKLAVGLLLYLWQAWPKILLSKLAAGKKQKIIQMPLKQEVGAKQDPLNRVKMITGIEGVLLVKKLVVIAGKNLVAMVMALVGEEGEAKTIGTLKITKIIVAW